MSFASPNTLLYYRLSYCLFFYSQQKILIKTTIITSQLDQQGVREKQNRIKERSQRERQRNIVLLLQSVVLLLASLSEADLVWWCRSQSVLLECCCILVSIFHCLYLYCMLQSQCLLLGSKDLGFYVFRTLMCIVGKS